MENIFISGRKTDHPYTRPGLSMTRPPLFPRNIEGHSATLIRTFENLWSENTSRDAVGFSNERNTYIEFKSTPNEPIDINGLEDLRANIRILNSKQIVEGENKYTKTIISIPNTKRQNFLDKLTRYGSNETKKTLWNVIDDMSQVTLESLWTGPINFTELDENRSWYEVWLYTDARNQDEFDRVRTTLKNENVRMREKVLMFSERMVILVFANQEELKKIIINVDNFCEFRPAQKIEDFFYELDRTEQNDWAEDLKNRTRISNTTNTVVTILDGGVNHNNILLEDFLRISDVEVYNPLWNTSDNFGHGTNMAGIAAYYSLQDAIESQGIIEINHKLESGKIVSDATGSDNRSDLYGEIVQQVVSSLEITHPDRKRVLCMAVTADSNTVANGRPTSWSAALDVLISGRESDAEGKIFFDSAGNIRDLNDVANYTSAQVLSSIEDPGQSWNAITVGGYTEFSKLVPPQTRVADANEISPFTRSSISWDRKRWPIKPEIVLEAGNAVLIGGQGYNAQECSILTTSHDIRNNIFTSFSGTSPATAQASFLASEIQAYYPDMWAETVRGLMIHSAEWTEEMKNQILDGDYSKQSYGNLLRIAGYGVPSIDRAIKSVENRVNMIIEAEIQPYKQGPNSIVTNEMHLYDLPWPKRLLEEYYDSNIKLKVTLSYFIEPSPGERGWNNRYRYSSCGLRFDINGPTDDDESFLSRINSAMREEDYESDGTVSWKYGVNNRNVGSIHSDVWETTGAELANSNYIAVYPVAGWWKDRKAEGKFNDRIKYALIVSLEAENDINLYAPIFSQVSIPV